MNVRDMHIEVNQSLQKVAANKTRKFRSEEIDLVLNKIVGRFIRSKLKPKPGGAGFDIDQVDIDALRTLLVSKTLDAYYYTGNSVISFLPSDYEHLIRDSSYVLNLCGKPATTAEKTLKVLTLRQDKSSKSTQEYYKSMAITLGEASVSIPGSLPYANQYLGYKSKEDVAFLTPFLLAQLRQSGTEVYWERFYDMYKPSTYIMVGEGIPEIGSMTIDGIASTQFSAVTKSFKQFVGETGSVANRLYSSEVVGTIKSTAFFKPSFLSPVSELSQYNLIIHHDSSFIVNKVDVVYVRKPQTISLLLGTDCDLAEGFHQAICDLSVEYLKGRLGDVQGMQLAESDNERRVTL